MSICGTCKKDVIEGEKALACDDCDSWIHYTCGKMTKEEFKVFSDSSADHLWFCPECRPKTKAKISTLIRSNVDLNLEIEGLKLKIKTMEIEGAKSTVPIAPYVHDVGVNTEAQQTPLTFGDGIKWKRAASKSTLGDKKKKYTREEPSLTLGNRFNTLKSEEEEHGTLLLGDSIIKRQDREFCNKRPKYRRRRCFPGARTEDIIEVCKDEIKNTGKDTVHIISIGGNDNRKDPGLLNKFKDLINLYKQNRKGLKIIEIMPRMFDNQQTWDKTIKFNMELKKLCKEKDVQIIETWRLFSTHPELYGRDGVHLNYRGNAVLGNILNKSVTRRSGNV